jgi:hypothetical protein
MPTLRDILDRFRPAPGPGHAGPVGVPSVTTSTAADELGPVFTAIDEVMSRCEAIRDEGRTEAAQIRRQATSQLASLQAQAAATSARTRAAAAAAVQTAGQARRAVELAAAQAEAARIGADGAERISPFIAAAVSRVRNLADGAP